MDADIGKAQWAWARQLGQEWVETEAAGKVFKLYQDKEGGLVCCIDFMHYPILTHLLIFTLYRTFPLLGHYYATHSAASKPTHSHFLPYHG